MPSPLDRNRIRFSLQHKLAPGSQQHPHTLLTHCPRNSHRPTQHPGPADPLLTPPLNGSKELLLLVLRKVAHPWTPPKSVMTG